MAFDKAEMDMIRRGDMLGTKLGAKVATALETLEALRALFSLCEAVDAPFDEPGRPTVAPARAALSPKEAEE